MKLEDIAKTLENELVSRVGKSGMMFRIFSRVKSTESLGHKMAIKGDRYLSGKAKIQDMIGIRFVLYFPDDVEAMSIFLGSEDVVESAIDERDLATFCPQRLNLTKNIPPQFVEDFRSCLPEAYAPYIDSTYEVQIRTVFSEGWHEVEHDMRYKCKEDWLECEQFSRTLNAMLGTLETVEWGMKSLFHEMAYRNYLQGNFRAMLRNKMRIRLADTDFTPATAEYLQKHANLAKRFLATDRVVLILTLLNRDETLDLTYDNILFLANNIEINDKGLAELEAGKSADKHGDKP